MQKGSKELIGIREPERMDIGQSFEAQNISLQWSSKRFAPDR